MRTPVSARFEQILGVRFFDGSIDAAVEHLQRTRGYVVVPAAPAMVKMCRDPQFRLALTAADMAIADSGVDGLALESAIWSEINSHFRTRLSEGVALPA